MSTGLQRLGIRLKPLLTAILTGAGAGLVAILTYQAMMALQRLVWRTDSDTPEVGPLRIILTICIGGALLVLLGRISPTASVAELLREGDGRLGNSPRKIVITALGAVVAIAFGGAIGPVAGLLAVVAECSVIVSRFVARDEAQARAIAQAGRAGVLAGLYGSPPAAATVDESAPAPTRVMSFIAGLAGFGTFVFCARTVFGGEGVAAIPLPTPSAGAAWLLIIPALAGALIGICFRVVHHRAERWTSQFSRPWLVTVVGTLAFAGLAAAVPLTRFSGHHELGGVITLFDQGRGGALVVLALAKLAALVLCLVAGWRGGEVFPLIFIGAAVGAATALFVPGVNPAAAFAAAMAATLAAGWGRPVAGLFVLLLVVDLPVMVPLLVGCGVGIVVDRLVGLSAEDDPQTPAAASVPADPGH